MFDFFKRKRAENEKQERLRLNYIHLCVQDWIQNDALPNIQRRKEHNLEMWHCSNFPKFQNEQYSQKAAQYVVSLLDEKQYVVILNTEKTRPIMILW